MKKIYNVYDFGAVGDGIADDTAAVQAAIDEAAKEGAEVHFLPGFYSVGELFLHPESVLTANPNWGYGPNDVGSTVLRQRYDEQRCVLNFNHASRVTVNGLTLQGKSYEGECCGIYGEQEKLGITGAFRIERTKVSGFALDGIHLRNIGCMSIRGCQFGFSGRDGMHFYNSPDIFILDTWMSGNRGCGYAGHDENCSVTMTGCRLEWNGIGVAIYGGSHYQLTGNYIDRSYHEGVLMTAGYCKGYEVYCNTITMTGNIIYRSGKEDPTCAQLKMDRCVGVTVMGNNFCVGRDDLGAGVNSPEIGMQIKDCHQTVVVNNTLFMGATKTLIEQSGNVDSYIEQNPGSLYDQRMSEVRTLLPSAAAAISFIDPSVELVSAPNPDAPEGRVQQW